MKLKFVTVGALISGTVFACAAAELAADPASFAARLNEACALCKTGAQASVTLTLAPGDYPVTKFFPFNRNTCGSSGTPLVIRGVLGKPRPRFLGSVPLTGWRRAPFNGRTDAWTADAAHLDFGKARPELLFFDGVRMDEARYPNRDPARPYDGGWAYVPGRYVSMYRAQSNDVKNVVKVAPEDWHAHADPSEGRLNIFPRYNWWNCWAGISNCVDADCTLVLTKPLPEPSRPRDRYHTVGFREELDAPGEWYYDAKAKRFWFIPPAGVADPNAKPVTVPVSPWVFACSSVSNIRFENLEIAAAQGGFEIDACTNLAVVGCAIHDTGTFRRGAVHISRGARCRVADCDIWNIGRDGVNVSAYANRTMFRSGHVVENNYLHHCGQFDRHGFGVNMNGLGIAVRHNLIHDMPRCGIFHTGRFNEISYNRVRHVNLEMEDTGAIYNCGSTTGTGCEIKYNHVSHSIGFGHVDQGYGFGHTASGIYLDDGSGGYRVYGNLVHDCRHVGMHLHCARFSVVSNNVFISNATRDEPRYGQFNFSGWMRPGSFDNQRKHMDPAWRSLVKDNPAWTNYPALRAHPDDLLLPDGHYLRDDELVNNIFYYPNQTNTMYITAHAFNPKVHRIDNNVIFGSTALRSNYLTNTVATLAAWQAKGLDVHSVTADPLFADPAKGDWRLRPESPALKLGFKPLPLDEMGLKPSPYRPADFREAEGAREHPETIAAAADDIAANDSVLADHPGVAGSLAHDADRWTFRFRGKDGRTGLLKGVDSAFAVARWTDPRTGASLPDRILVPDAHGNVSLPLKPDAQEWVLTVTRKTDGVTLAPGAAAVLDFGPRASAGYATFTVSGVQPGAKAVLRVSYANHPDGLGEKGDFWRETAARYLGPDVDLPILPANIDRYELYALASNGVYRAPLLQGLVRYARLKLEGGAGSVRIDRFALANDRVYSEGERQGTFDCSDRQLATLWEASARTCELASIPSYDSAWGPKRVRTLPYVADGAKRDRLVWSGDLWFAERSCFYAFKPWAPYMKGSVLMLAANQTPEGYVQASPWPDQAVPKAGEWGPFGSDEFACWLVPVAWDYHLHTGDAATAKKIYPVIRRLMAYLARYQNAATGLFEQRKETCKHAAGLVFGSTSLHHRSYMNILLWRTYEDAAKFAELHGAAADAAAWRASAARLAQTIRTTFWDGAKGHFVLAAETKDSMGPEANALALATGFATADEAASVMPQLQYIRHGKFQQLAARGKCAYGAIDAGLAAIDAHNWRKICDPGWEGVQLVSECMHMIRKGWGDEAHPDTALAGLFTNYLLGVEPLTPGFATFAYRIPETRRIAWARGTVPTPHGEIRASWEKRADEIDVSVRVPPATRCRLEVPGHAPVELGPGTFRQTFARRPVPSRNP